MSAGASPARRFQLPTPVAFVGVSIAFASFFLAAGAPTPLLPIYETEWGFAPSLLTLAFGVYAIALLAALLVFGSLSDHIGRRPVLVLALGLELGSMVVFLVAPSIEWVVAARVLQGIATGIATSAFTAAILELAPAHQKRRGAIMGSVSPAVGLGGGSLLAGAVAQFNGAAAFTIWLTLTMIMTLGTLFAIFIPETVSRRPGARASLIPRLAVPARVRRQFTVAVPSQAAAWMLGALFMGLMPTILGSVFAHHSPFENGLTASLQPIAGGVAAVATGRVAPQRLLIFGGFGVILGAALVTSGIAAAILPLVWVGGVVGGLGFGSVLSGTLRILGSEVEAHERAELFAAIYLVAYLAFGVPAIVAGALVPVVGLTAVAIAFGVVIVVGAGLGVAGQLRLARLLSRP